MGIVLAYLINPMVEFYDRKLSNSLGKAIEKKCGKRPSMRGLSILISLAIIIAIIVVLIMMVVPQLEAISQMRSVFYRIRYRTL